MKNLFDNMRKIALLIISLPLMAFSQSSYDVKIAEAMNASDWFALDSIYEEAPKDSISEFLEVYSRCMLGHSFNRTDVSIPAFAELLNAQSANLDVRSLISAAIMYGMDLSRVGANGEAAQMLTAVRDALKPHVKADALRSVGQFATLYSALSRYQTYQIAFADSTTGVIPFSIERIAPGEKKTDLIRLRGSVINGIGADIVFDTGAGTNLITDSLAARYGLIPLDAPLDIAGFGMRTGHYALAKELKIGNITVSNVPFMVVSMLSGDAEADQYLRHLGVIVGAELMLQLKDLTFDFLKHEITVPAVAPLRSGEKPNMCFSSGMVLLAKAVVNNTPLNVFVDTGNPHYADLANAFFETNKAYVRRHGKKETIRRAGIGGKSVAKYYRVPDMRLTLGGTSVVVPAMDVKASRRKSAWMGGYNNLGLSSLMLFSKVRFNMADFVLTTESR